MKQYWFVIILGGLFLLPLALLVVFGTVWQNVWLLGMGAEEWTFFAGWTTVTLFVLLTGVGWLKLHPGHRVAVVIVTLLVLGAVFLFAFSQYIFRADSDYHVYTSPNGQHTVIVKVKSFLLNSWGTFYQQTSPITMERIGSFNLGDYYPGIEFDFVWGETGCQVVFLGETAVLEWVE